MFFWMAGAHNSESKGYEALESEAEGDSGVVNGSGGVVNGGTQGLTPVRPPAASPR